VAMRVKDYQKELQKEYPKTKIILDKYKYHLRLVKIIIPPAKRCTGIGTAILTHICAYCDKNNLVCKLIPSSEFGSNLDRLIEFYFRFGFEFDLEKDFMIRNPLKQKD